MFFFQIEDAGTITKLSNFVPMKYQNNKDHPYPETMSVALCILFEIILDLVCILFLLNLIYIYRYYIVFT